MNDFDSHRRHDEPPVRLVATVASESFSYEGPRESALIAFKVWLAVVKPEMDPAIIARAEATAKKLDTTVGAVGELSGKLDGVSPDPATT